MVVSTCIPSRAAPLGFSAKSCMGAPDNSVRHVKSVVTVLKALHHVSEHHLFLKVPGGYLSIEH